MSTANAPKTLIRPTPFSFQRQAPNLAGTATPAPASGTIALQAPLVATVSAAEVLDNWAKTTQTLV